MRLEEEKAKELIRQLSTGNEARILSAIDEIRSVGDPVVLPAIIALVNENKPGIIGTAAIELLNDLKDEGTIPYIMDALKTGRGKTGYRYLVSSCWQNGLDYSAHLEFFIELMFEENLEISMEAFSVIEENLHSVDISRREKMAARLNSFPASDDNTKNLLIGQLGLLIKDSLTS